MADNKKVTDFGSGTTSGIKVYGVRSGADTGAVLGSAAGTDTGTFLSDTGALAFLSDTGFALSDTGFALSDTGQFPTKTATVIGKQLIYMPAGAMTAATTSGAASAIVEDTGSGLNYAVLDFDASSDEYACFDIPMPDSWDESTITYKVEWTTTDTGTSGVAWGLQAVAIADGSDIETAYGTGVINKDDSAAQPRGRYTTGESGAVTVSGAPTAGELTQFRVYRDVSDTGDDMTQDARLRGVSIFYTVDKGNES